MTVYTIDSSSALLEQLETLQTRIIEGNVRLIILDSIAALARRVREVAFRKTLKRDRESFGTWCFVFDRPRFGRTSTHWFTQTALHLCEHHHFLHLNAHAIHRGRLRAKTDPVCRRIFAVLHQISCRTTALSSTTPVSQDFAREDTMNRQELLTRQAAVLK